MVTEVPEAQPQPAYIEPADPTSPPYVAPQQPTEPIAPVVPAYGQPQPDPAQQMQYGQQPPPAQTAYGQQPPAYGQVLDPYQASAYAAPAGPPKVASAYYVAIVALIFAFLGGLLGMILAAVALWLAKKQAGRGMIKTEQARMIANMAFLISFVVFIIVINL